MTYCQSLEFSPEVSKQRFEQARRIFGASVLRRILCFALYLLGAKRSKIASVLEMPLESVKTTLRVLNRDGLGALEDRRQSQSTFLPQANNTQALKVAICKDENHFVITFLPTGADVKVAHGNVVQAKTLFLSLLNSGLISSKDVSEVLGLTSSHIRELAKKLDQEDVLGLINKQRGQIKNYRMTPEAEVLLIQQFAAHAVTGKPTSSLVLAQELNKEADINVSARTVRVHTNKLRLLTIAKSLPQLVDTIKKKLHSIVQTGVSRLLIGVSRSIPLSGFTSSRIIRRTQIVSLHNSGIEKSAIAKFTGCSSSTIYRWSNHPMEKSLDDKTRTGCPAIFTDNAQLCLIGFYCQSSPLSGCGRWTIRWAESYLKKHPEVLGISISRSSIHRILRKHNLKPHLTKYFLQITDPDFFPKMQHLLDLYNRPPEHLFFFDECPGIQILMRLAPNMTTEQQKKWLKEFEYNRNGTLDVLAFLEYKTGKVSAECAFDHKSATFNRIFESHVAAQPPDVQIDYVVDNLSSHCNEAFVTLVAKLSDVEYPHLETAQERRDWLQSGKKRIIIHFTPFHGSWLNLVEIWFGILNQKCLKESYKSAEDLIETIRNFLDIWNTLLAHPFNWKYDGKGLHEKAVRRFINIISNKCNPLPEKFLLKQLLLMNNLIYAYWDNVPREVWTQLSNALQSKQSHIEGIIEKDDKPKRRAETVTALQDLQNGLSSHLNNEQHHAA